MKKFLVAVLLTGVAVVNSAENSVIKNVQKRLISTIPKNKPVQGHQQKHAEIQKSSNKNDQSASCVEDSSQSCTQKQAKSHVHDQSRAQCHDERRTQGHADCQNQVCGQTKTHCEDQKKVQVHHATGAAVECHNQGQTRTQTKTSWTSSKKKAINTKKQETQIKSGREQPPEVQQIEVLSMRVHEEDIDNKIPSFSFGLLHAKSPSGYTLVAKNMYGDQEILHPSLARSSSGQLMEDSHPYQLCTLAMGPGEALTIIAFSKDGLEQGETTIIPRPLQTSCNGYTLSLKLADPENRTFHLKGSGFAPKEEIQLFTCSGQIQIRDKLVANEYGEINSTLMHQAKENLGGEAYVELVGKNGPASMIYPWGNEYKKELRELRKIERNLVSQ